MNDNKLIAEFMGWNIQNYNELPNNFWNTIREIDFDVDDGYRFHNSWDWLMPVVEKIYLLDAHIDFFRVINFEATYKRVVEFIKEYNKDED